MIDQETLLSLRTWFSEYVKKFQLYSPAHKQNINLKEEHTKRVCIEIINIGKSLNLNKQDLRLAESIALLHDVGRFEQYDRYRTFSDAKSEDHAQLGIKIIRQIHILKEIAQPTSDLILRTISYHNHPTLPQKETERCLFFTKLLRDADKLDILYVVTDYYKNGSEHPNEILELELPDTPKISDAVYKHLISGGIVNARHLQTLTDFKLLQMAWIYDINFPRTFQLIQQGGYLEMIRDALPQLDKVQKIYSAVKSYLHKKCKPETTDLV